MSKTTDTERNLQKIVDDLSALIDVASHPARMSKQADSVSKWSIGRHVEHLALSDEFTLDGLSKLLANPEGGKAGSPNLVGRLCLWAGYIPRGRGQAPKGVVPQGIQSEIVHDKLLAVRQGFVDLQASADQLSDSIATVPHPVFGRLDASRWLRFTVVHHNHHQKIMRDIERAAKG